MNRDRRQTLLANQLAKYFNLNNDEISSPCACSGLDVCRDLKCAI